MPTYKEITKRLKRKGLAMPPVDRRIEQQLPVVETVAVCPHCNEPVPIRVIIASMKIAVQYADKVTKIRDARKGMYS